MLAEKMNYVKMFNTNNLINRQDNPLQHKVIRLKSEHRCATGMSEKQVVSIPTLQLSRPGAGEHKAR